MSEPRDYLRVRPSSQPLHVGDIAHALASLHKLTVESQPSGLARFLPGTSSYPPRFEFLAVSEGTDAPVEFYYGTDGDLDALEDRLRSIYPTTFDIDRTELDLATKLIPPVAYSCEEFIDRLADGQLHFEPTEDDLRPVESERAVLEDGGTQTTSDATGSSHATMEYGDGVLRVDRVRSVDDPMVLTQPTLTDDGQILARPSVEEVVPMGVRWHGVAERKLDWMTTITPFTDHVDTAVISDDTETRVPLAAVIDTLVEADSPMAFQVVFQRKPDWSAEAWQREHDIKHGLDTLYGKARDFFDPVTPDEPNLSGQDEARLECVQAKKPKRTFTVNVRAVACPRDETAETQLDSRLDALATALDTLDGRFYGFEGHRLQASGFRQTASEQYARAALERLLDRELVTGRGKTRFDLVLNAEELANLITVPSGETLSRVGARGTRAKQQSRTPPPEPPAERLQQFDSGITLGPALGSNGQPHSKPVQLPPSLQKRHILRCAPPGHGKTIGLTNDALSAYDDTSGPVIILDSKGGGFATNYMRAHAARFGFDDFQENVLYFPVHEVLPGLAFFDIAPTLEYDDFDRVTASQHKADHYEEVLKLAMGTEKYERASVAPTLIKHLVKTMYDAEHGLENGRYRESVDAFSHAQLRHVVHQVWQAGPPNRNPDRVPQSSDPEARQTFDHLLNRDAQTFSTIMGGLDTRMEYITEDVRLRRLFDNTTSNFDFRDRIHEQQVIIFDLGRLRDDPATVLTGALLTSLYDAVRESHRDDSAGKPDNYVINVLIDEAASVVATDTISELLSRGREFDVSLELATQFPEQILESGDRETYLNTLRNTGTKLIGNIHVDDELAGALAHEDMDRVDFRNRVNSLANDEWLVDVPSPQFSAPDPNPFYVQAPPVPAGHPASDAPLSDAEDARFQESLEVVRSRTRDVYGVEDGNASPADAVPEELRNRLGAADGDLDEALAHVIRALQLREGVREENDWVPVEAVDTELQRVFADVAGEAGIDGGVPDYETLADVREHSQLLTVDIDAESNTLVVRLTEAGEEAVTPELGDVQAAGGQAHDDGILEIEEALTTAGFTVELITQDGSEQPDARATHPELDNEFAIEVETTTPENPIKVLTNLKKAQDEDSIPLFVVRPGETETYWAERIEGILHPPVKQLSNGETQLYTYDEPLHVRRVSTGERFPAVRPVTGEGDSRRTIWRRGEEDIILVDSAGIEQGRILGEASATEHNVPGVYTYDAEANKYVVTADGTRHTYDSKAAFDAEWVTIKKPFIPENELPVPDYGRDTYRIVILASDGEAVVYDSAESTSPLSTLLMDSPLLATSRDDQTEGTPDQADSIERDGAESIASGDSSENTSPKVADRPTEGDSPLQFDPEDPEELLSAFVTRYLREDPDAVTPKDRIYKAFTIWSIQHGGDVPEKSSFSKRLREHVDCGDKRVSNNGERTYCYTDIELSESGCELLE
ncbi:conjugal transfer protein [Halomarina pelagica]|uniref:conjugal transfer protein n=1 Tax=Halomarina pelagica TaxID=2961599 RepID=UPI0020C1D0AB|nr:conjugal transfer protein [Halomarina sp. BND7]